MRVWITQQVVSVLVAASCSVAIADYSGEDWADPDFQTYKVKKILLSVSGKWEGSKAQVDERDVTETLTKMLIRKGYEVVTQPKDPADATLVVAYVALSKAGPGNTVNGTAQLTLGKTEKVIFRAKGEAQGVKNVTVGHAFCRIIDKLPSLPDEGPRRRKKAK
ncbi:MAG: hypothetical protein AB1696_17355 [Planctomycetota bacterium]